MSQLEPTNYSKLANPCSHDYVEMVASSNVILESLGKISDEPVSQAFEPATSPRDWESEDSRKIAVAPQHQSCSRDFHAFSTWWRSCSVYTLHLNDMRTQDELRLGN